MKARRGFTLIELLIVIGILAVLATMTVLILNPAELFKQARDSQRMSDFKSIMKAVEFVRTMASADPTFPSQAKQSVTGGAICGTLSGSCGTGGTAVNGSGWVGIDLTDGSLMQPPLTKLPLDPVNNSSNYYAYKGNLANKTYELNTIFESVKYIPMMSADGGGSINASDHTLFYEVGTDPGLDL